MLTLIKVDEIGQNEQTFYMKKIFKTGTIFWEQAQCVCTVVKMAAKKAPFSNHMKLTQLDEALDQSETPLC